MALIYLLTNRNLIMDKYANWSKSKQNAFLFRLCVLTLADLYLGWILFNWIQKN